jgi:hypothetical protein
MRLPEVESIFAVPCHILRSFPSLQKKLRCVVRKKSVPTCVGKKLREIERERKVDKIIEKSTVALFPNYGMNKPIISALLLYLLSVSHIVQNARGQTQSSTAPKGQEQRPKIP